MFNMAAMGKLSCGPNLIVVKSKFQVNYDVNRCIVSSYSSCSCPILSPKLIELFIILFIKDILL